MENYAKGRNVEPSPEEDREAVPFRGLPEDFVLVRVRPGTKIRNVLGFALRAAEERGDSAAVVFAGHGQALNKVVSCAEIARRRMAAQEGASVLQYSHLGTRTVEEHWEPREDASEEGLAPLKVVRQIPQVHVALTRGACVVEGAGPQGSLGEFLDCGDMAVMSGGKRRRGGGGGGQKRGGGRRAAEELGMVQGGGGNRGRGHGAGGGGRGKDRARNPPNRGGRGGAGGSSSVVAQEESSKPVQADGKVPPESANGAAPKSES